MRNIRVLRIKKAYRTSVARVMTERNVRCGKAEFNGACVRWQLSRSNVAMAASKNFSHRWSSLVIASGHCTRFWKFLVIASGHRLWSSPSLFYSAGHRLWSSPPPFCHRWSSPLVIASPFFFSAGHRLWSSPLPFGHYWSSPSPHSCKCSPHHCSFWEKSGH
ncbi:hypothetical protein BDB00DRAFT_303197 [Zychaea mexicana]|uniref:uncharacterized protein n=1 Tax=Zychaea mexicana TaxID=64656 RepID=UPI0022FE3D35|nr:uncharacterized protein BDB00DRAFT_303197 [Zychaea mexicana]KAI9467575.1 hypothetical protein BDB00DRAFT_303197 [Zychaea mexicana]